MGWSTAFYTNLSVVEVRVLEGEYNDNNDSNDSNPKTNNRRSSNNYTSNNRTTHPAQEEPTFTTAG